MNHFAGIITPSSSDKLENEIRNMLLVMSHPNKDISQSVVRCENAIFAQSEIPIETNYNDQFLLGLQGRIFNLPELKEKLIADGQVVHKDRLSDLVFLAYLTWGPHFLEFLNGSFILFLYDKKDKKLLIARDKVGIQRLYWGKFNQTFVFSTQLKGVLSSEHVPQKPCLESISAYFHLGYFPQDKTPIQSINCLLPGYYLLIDHEMTLQINKYWSFRASQDPLPNATIESVSQRLDELLTQSFQRRVDCSQPVSCLLSGEIGSASLAYYTHKLAPGKGKAFMKGFTENAQAYSPYVDTIAGQFQLPLEKIILNPDQMCSDLSRLIWHLDEPISDPSSVAIWQVAQAAKQYSNQIISPLGSQEFLGTHLGNTSLYYEPLFVWFLQMVRPLILRAGIPLISKINKRAAFSALRYFEKDFWANEYIQQYCLYNHQSLKKIAPNLTKQFDPGIYVHQTYQYLKYIHFQNFDVADYFFYDAETTLCNYLLVQYQNLFSAHGIQLSCPFMDEDIIRFLIHVPEALKSRRKRAGLPLQKILEGQLSYENLNFNYERTPKFLNSWMDTAPMQQVFDLVTKGVLAESEIISARGLKEELRKNTWTLHKFERYWSILVLEIWFKLFINRPIHTYPENQPILELLNS